ncbi:MAG: hypothetical protein ACI88L_000087 [Candidatus Paceibacteria bacterium]|jgi:hypothetical protein
MSLSFITTTLFLSGCGNTCLNPDCKFEKLVPPVKLDFVSVSQVQCRDSEGVVWSSNTEWDIAKAIVSKGYKSGDTVIEKY